MLTSHRGLPVSASLVLGLHHAQLFTSVLGLELMSLRLDGKPLTAEPGLQRLCLFSSWLPHQLLLFLAHSLVSPPWHVMSLPCTHYIPLSPWLGEIWLEGPSLHCRGHRARNVEIIGFNSRLTTGRKCWGRQPLTLKKTDSVIPWLWLFNK